MDTKKLSRIMRMSWEIQKLKKRTRSKALQSAWAIMLNEDITTFYLVQRYTKRPTKYQSPLQMGLFRRS